ncbi:MAG: DUF4296 domain-containing protein [Algicola sp.]|nr:DUF4296 domain-containing protein [Algicola sp.]
MRKSLIYSCFVLLVLGCDHTPEIEKPKNLISEDNMASIMIDVALLSSAKGVNKKKLEQKKINPEAYIYKKYGVDSLQFALSNAYYASDSKTYTRILDTITSRLERFRARYNKLAKKEADEKQKKDSIARVEKFGKKKIINAVDQKRIKKD